MSDDGDARVRDALQKMNRNFAGLAGQFELVGAAATRAATAMGETLGSMVRSTVKPINRMAGMLAAREDWAGKLWPLDEETDDREES